jgi:hypothetical protein
MHSTESLKHQNVAHLKIKIEDASCQQTERTLVREQQEAKDVLISSLPPIHIEIRVTENGDFQQRGING